MDILKSTSSLEKELRDKYNVCENWIQNFKQCPDSLYSIMSLHKAMWGAGVQHDTFGPSPYGYFRTDSIDNLSIYNTYLGDRNGIWTNPISEFEKPDFKYVGGVEPARGEKGELTKEYRTICAQYRNHMLSNLNAMKFNIYDHGYNRQRVESLLEEGANFLSGGISNLKIKNESIDENKVLFVEFVQDGTKHKNSSVVNIDGKFYFPQDFAKGVQLDPSHIDAACILFPLFDALNGNRKAVSFSKQQLKDMKISIYADKTEEMSRAVVKENIKHVADYSKKRGVKFGM